VKVDYKNVEVVLDIGMMKVDIGL